MSEPYVVIELEGPPRGKGRPRFSTRGGFVRAFTDKATVDYENCLKAAGIAAMAARSLKPLNEAITVRIRAFMPVPESWSTKKRAAALAGDIAHTSRPDKDNLEKAALDGLNGITWVDDSQVIGGDFLKLYDERPRLRIEVYRWF